MKYPRILAAIRSARWAVTPPTLQAIRDTLSARLTGRLTLADDMPGEMDDEEDMDELPDYEMIAPAVAAVKLHGIIGRGLSSMEMACGGCDIARVEANLRAALADLGVASVVLDIDSPGGAVTGVAEFADKIGQLSAASGKPVLAYASGQCASAAYWIACGCNGIACSPSSDVGSIGVYMALVDESENWKTEGYKLVLIKAGDHKAAGIAGSQVTPEQIALWQADVDHIYSQFTAAVKASRPGIADAVLQGQTFYGDRALAAGLVDEIAPDLLAMAAEVSPIA
jgi:signal peptide peptidase SppA